MAVSKDHLLTVIVGLPNAHLPRKQQPIPVHQDREHQNAAATDQNHSYQRPRLTDPNGVTRLQAKLSYWWFPLHHVIQRNQQQYYLSNLLLVISSIPAELNRGPFACIDLIGRVDINRFKSVQTHCIVNLR